MPTHTCMDTVLCAHGQLTHPRDKDRLARETHKVSPGQTGQGRPKSLIPTAVKTILWLPAKPNPHTVALAQLLVSRERRPKAWDAPTLSCDRGYQTWLCFSRREARVNTRQEEP